MDQPNVIKREKKWEIFLVVLLSGNCETKKIGNPHEREIFIILFENTFHFFVSPNGIIIFG